eukprot:4226124-Pyramimonas_sp.AAC.1
MRAPMSGGRGGGRGGRDGGRGGRGFGGRGRGRGFDEGPPDSVVGEPLVRCATCATVFRNGCLKCARARKVMNLQMRVTCTTCGANVYRIFDGGATREHRSYSAVECGMCRPLTLSGCDLSRREGRFAVRAPVSVTWKTILFFVTYPDTELHNTSDPITYEFVVPA